MDVMFAICTVCTNTAIFHAKGRGGEEMLPQLIPHQLLPSKLHSFEKQER